MAKKTIELDLDIKGNIEPTIANLKKLKLQLKDTASGSDEFKKIYNQIDDLEDKIKGARKGSADWIDTLEAAGGPLGMLGASLNKAKVATVSFGTALKATGIGLIVSAVGLLVTAFTKTEGSMKKLEPLFIQLEKILGGLVEAFMPLIEGFAELALQVLPYAIKGITTFYGSLVAFFTLIKEAGTGVGKILKGIFTLDTDSITEGYDQLKGSWGKTIQRYDQFQADYDKGSKKLTATEKKNLEERNKNQEEADKKREEQRKAQQEIIDRAALAQANEFDKKRIEARKKLQEDEIVAANNHKALLAARQNYAITITNIDKEQIAARKAIIAQLADFEASTIQNAIAAQQNQIVLLDKQQLGFSKMRLKFNDTLNANEKFALDRAFQLHVEYYDKDRATQREEYAKTIKDENERREKLKEYDANTIKYKDIITDTLLTQQENYYIKLDTDKKTFEDERLKTVLDEGDKLNSINQNYYNRELELLDQQYLTKLGKDSEYYKNRDKILVAQQDRLDEIYVAEQESLQKLLDAKVITEKEFNAQKLTLEKDYTVKSNQLTQSRIDTSKAERDAKLSDIQTIAAAFGTLATAFADYTAAYKIAALAQIAIDTGVAISRVIAVISAGPAASNPFSYIAAIATQIATITVNIAKAIRLVEGASVPTSTTPGASTTNTNFGPTPINVVATRAEGGFVYGQGNSRSDSIPAMLSNGEFVVNSQSASMFAPLLSTINSIGNQPQFRMSGLVGGNNSMNNGLESLAQTLTSNMSSRPIQTYVVSEQMSNQQQFDRTIKSRSLM